jgi:hypothetical protein
MKTIQTSFLVMLSLGTLLLAGCGHSGTASSIRTALNKLGIPGDGSAAQIEALSQQYSLSIGVDIRDVAHYKATLSREAQTLIASFKNDPQTYFPSGVRFLPSGITANQDTQKNSVYGVEFQDFEIESDGTRAAVINALYHSEAGGFTFRSFDILFSADGLKILKAEFVRDLALNQTHFSAHLGLMQRKVVLEDEEHNIRKIFPIGIGGFSVGTENRGILSPLTPKIRMAVLEKSEAIFSRTYPSYYSGRPFIRISSGIDGYTVFGLHYSITEELIRGFVSHGCIRMRDKDLYELYYILTGGGDATISLEMRYWLKDLADTPYPLDDSEYQRVKNFGTDENPEVARGKDGLLILEEHRGTPPESGFVDNLARFMNLQ